MYQYVSKAPPDNLRYRQPTNSTDPTRRERRYLEVLWYLCQRHEPVLAVQLVRWLDARPPTVSQVLRLLESKDYIERSQRGDIVLTQLGHAQAQQIVYRHRLLERFLFDVVHVPWYLLHREATDLEHALSERIVQRMQQLVSGTDTSPYGHPLQFSDPAPTSQIRLSDAPEGCSFVIQRIDEEAEEDQTLLHEFAVLSVLPHMQVHVLSNASLLGLTVQTEQRTLTLTPEHARLVWGIVNGTGARQKRSQ